MYICKNCGGKATKDKNNLFYCEECQRSWERNGVLDKHTCKARITQLKAMHTLMCEANDESIYMSWAMCGVPDCPSEDDFEGIALDAEMYNEVFDLFVKLIQDKDNRW